MVRGAQRDRGSLANAIELSKNGPPRIDALIALSKLCVTGSMGQTRSSRIHFDAVAARGGACDDHLADDHSRSVAQGRPIRLGGSLTVSG